LQAPAAQLCVAPQKIPQPPQLSPSVFVSVHRPLHRDRPVPHEQALFTQVWPEPARQRVLQPPQLFKSVVVSTQAPLQLV
jgi:hypothetical protein